MEPTMKRILPIAVIVSLCSAQVIFAKPGLHEKPDTRRDSQTRRNFEFGLNTSAVMYYFHIASNKKSEKQELDFSDARNDMKYRISPVIMASFQSYARWNFLTLRGDYSTDRFFSAGGDITQDDEVASKLTKNRTFSDILRLGIEVFDLNTSYRMVQFDFGKVDVCDYQTGTRLSQGRMKLNITDIDISYDFRPFKKINPEINFVVSPGYRYMDYRVPRIVYRFEDEQQGEQDLWQLSDESDPQTIRTRTHMAGALFDMSTNIAGGNYRLIGTTGIHAGPGKTRFEMNGSTKRPTLATVAGTMKTGIEYRFLRGTLKGGISFIYDLTMINTMSAETNSRVNDSYSESKVKYVFGSNDYYHGFFLSLNASY